MVLCGVLLDLGRTFSLAHVNYQLRGAESEADENFVRQFASKNKLPFFLHKPGQEGNTPLAHEGVQEWARRVRYAWFDELINEHHGDYILVAHHQLDQAETIVHQFIRGGGISSLSGMARLRGRILRPMLSIGKQEIVDYAIANDVEWRDDSSNQTQDYTRNFIRQEVIPRLTEINPDIVNSMQKRAVWYREADAIIHEVLAREIAQQRIEKNGQFYFQIQWLADHTAPHLLLWAIMENWGFTSAQVEGVLELMKSESGRRVTSNEASFWRDREYLILEPKQQDRELSELSISEIPFEFENPIRLKGSWIDFQNGLRQNESESIILDLEKIKLPLLIRPWVEGDHFRPFGMQGRKKVSDLLIQHKVPLPDKNRIYVLCCGETILWVIGLRSAEEIRIENPFGKLVRISFQP